MGEAALASNYSIEEYLQLEAESDIRHEYHNGEIFAMAGGTRNHGKLGGNIITRLTLIEENRPCTSFNGDVKIRIDSSNKFVYPEASVVCGQVKGSQHDPESITNPILIVEVLSDSTEAYDRGEKFRLYRSLPSFQEYILIDQKRPIVSIYRKKDDKIWEMEEVVGLDQVVSLRSLDAEIKMSDLYQKVEGLK